MRLWWVAVGGFIRLCMGTRRKLLRNRPRPFPRNWQLAVNRRGIVSSIACTNILSISRNSHNSYFRLSIGLSVVAVFLFGIYSIRGHLASSAKNTMLQNPLQGEARDAYENFKSQSAESLSLLKDTIQKQSESMQSASSAVPSREP